MDAKSLIEVMKGNLQSVRQQNVTQFPIENIEAWVAALENFVESHPNEEPSPQQRDLQQRQWEAQLAQYKADHESHLEGFRSTIQFGLMALKTSILINGGAVVAILAFIGHVWDSKLFYMIQAPITDSLFSFFVGVLFAAVATATSYFTQAFYSELKKEKAAICFRIVTVLLVVASYFCFYKGGEIALKGFKIPLQNEAQAGSIANLNKPSSLKK